MVTFKAKEVAGEIVEWLREYAKESNTYKVVLGISGGKDSTVAAALCCEAFGKENVYGVLMPCGHQTDIADSYRVCNILGIESFNIDIGGIMGEAVITIDGKVKITDDAGINMKPRIRMLTLYTIAQSIGARVCGTGNLSERLVGYCTKWGDMASDFNPLANLTCNEVVEIGIALGLPVDLINKTPADGLTNKTDEDRLGVSYDSIHNYIRLGFESVDAEDAIRIAELNKKAKHKLGAIPSFKLDLS